MTNDAELVAEGLLQGLTQLLPGVATILGTLGIMAVLNPFIAFVVVAVTPVSIWFAGFVAKRTASFSACRRGTTPSLRRAGATFRPGKSSFCALRALCCAARIC